MGSLADAFAWVGKKLFHLKLQEQSPVLDGIDKDDYLYRSLSVSPKDITPYIWERQEKIAYYLFLTNPICLRIIETAKDFTVGDGIEFHAEEPAVQKVLERFWDDELNYMELRQFDMALELSLSGEQIIVPTVNEIDGSVIIESLDPLQVAKVEYMKKNRNIPDKLHLKRTSIEDKEKMLSVIRTDRYPFSDDYGRLVGDAFFFAVNKVTQASRGHSDVMALLDWMEGYDEYLYSGLERAQFLNSYIWDVEIEGADQTAIDDFLQKLPQPRPGSIRAHNEKVKWNALAPELNSTDLTGQAKLVRSHILTGAGLPEDWFTEGGFVYKGKDSHTTMPAMKRFKVRQKQFKAIIRRIFEFVIDQAQKAGVLPEDINISFSIHIASPERNSMEKAEVLLRMTNALMIARENGWVEDSEAKAIFQMYLNEMGVEIDKLRRMAKGGAPPADKPDTDEEKEARDYMWAIDRIREREKTSVA